MKNSYDVIGDTVIIYVIRKGKTYEVLIDKDDLPFLSDFRGTWHLDNRGYVRRTIKGKISFMHRILTNPPEGFVVDHIDGNTLNNKRNNLRVVKPGHNQQNIRNPHKISKTGSKGVREKTKWGKKYRAYVTVNKKEISLGGYDNKEDAEIAAIIGRILYHPYSKEALIYKKLLDKKNEK